MHTIRVCKILLLAGVMWIVFVLFLDHHWERIIEREEKAENYKNPNELNELEVKQLIHDEVQKELERIEENNQVDVMKRFREIQELVKKNQEMIRNGSMAALKAPSSSESFNKDLEILVPQEIPSPPPDLISTSSRKSWKEFVTEIPAEVLDSLSLQSRGENGQGVFIANPPPEVQKRIEAGWAAHQFNEFVSDIISVNRSVPDPRSQYCLRQNYSDNLPKTSVIIIFHNEAWSTLLRTVHSVLNRSPEHLIEEVILVDDASTMGEIYFIRGMTFNE